MGNYINKNSNLTTNIFDLLIKYIPINVIVDIIAHYWIDYKTEIAIYSLNKKNIKLAKPLIITNDSIFFNVRGTNLLCNTSDHIIDFNILINKNKYNFTHEDWFNFDYLDEKYFNKLDILTNNIKISCSDFIVFENNRLYFLDSKTITITDINLNIKKSIRYNISDFYRPFHIAINKEHIYMSRYDNSISWMIQVFNINTEKSYIYFDSYSIPSYEKQDFMSLYYYKDNLYILLSNAKILYKNKKKFKFINLEYKSPTILKKLVIYEDNFYVSNKNEITIFDFKGKRKNKIVFNQDILDIVVKNDLLYVAMNKLIKIYYISNKNILIRKNLII